MILLIVITIITFLTASSLQTISFQAEPADAIVKVGEPFSLFCSANSSVINGALVITWKHNYTWITDYTNKHFNLLADGTLSFIHFLPSDQGLYQCSAIVFIANVHKEQEVSRIASIRIPFLGSSFLHTISNIHEKLGSTVHLQCISPESIPTAIVYWQKGKTKLSGYVNGSLVLNERVSSTLEISNLSFSDVGSYKCCAVNSMIENSLVISHTIVLTVKANQASPYFLLEPVAVIATRYRSTVIHCCIMGIPLPNISWFKNDKEIYSNTFHKILSNGTLSFVRIKESDAGRYSCSGTNIHGSIKSLAVPLFVAFLDYDFLENPLSTTAISGHSLLLNCLAPKSYPPDLKITWYQEMQDVIIVTGRARLLSNGSLHITKVQVTDAGDYHCEALNKITNEVRTSKRATIYIIVPPTIYIHNSNISIPITQTLSISCNATGIPTPNVTLYKMNMKSNATQLLSSNGTIIIQTVSLTDQGLYCCSAENKAGRSVKYIHVVVQTPPSLVTSPTNHSVISKTSTFLNCSYSAVPKATVYWTLVNMQKLVTNITANTDNFQLLQYGLHIAKVEKEHEGWYTCNAFNAIGRDSTNAYLHVLVQPVIKINNHNVTVNLSQDAIFLCTISGDPSPSIKWKRKTLILQNNGDFYITNEESYRDGMHFTKSVLRIKHTSTDDSGVYECCGYSNIGNTSSSVHLVVQVPPKIISLWIESSFILGSSLTIRCSSFGIPTPKMILKHNHSIIYTEHNPRNHTVLLHFTLKNISSAESGLYKCISSNQLGLEQEGKNVTVKVYPGVPQLQQAYVLSPYSINVTWLSTFNGYSPIEIYSLEILSTKRSYEINVPATYHVFNHLLPYVIYQFRVRAKNIVGYGKFSIVKQARTLQAAPSVPRNVTYVNKTATSIKLRWYHPVHPNGLITLFQISYSYHNIAATSNLTIFHQHQHYEYFLSGLKAFTQYAIYIRAATKVENILNWGNHSDEIIIWTKESAPSVPINVTYVNKTATSIKLRWYQPVHPNGLITLFQISYSYHNIAATSNLTIFHQHQHYEYFLSGLKAFTQYAIYIRAATKVENILNWGNHSDGIIIWTKESVPSKVMNINVFHHNNTLIQISWNEPLLKNGRIIKYEINIINTKSNETTIYISTDSPLNIPPTNMSADNVTYMIYIVAVTSAGNSEMSDKFLFTKGGFILSTTISSTMVSKQPQRVAATWLDREYMIVIIAVSTFALFIFLVLSVVLLARSKCCKQSHKRKESGWEVNPYYNSNNSIDYGNNNFQLKKRSTPPTVRYRDFREDFIWDDESGNEVFENSSIEPEYEVARSGSLNNAPTKAHDGKKDKTSRATYTSVEPHHLFSKYPSVNQRRLKIDNVDLSNYADVEPYQGERLEFPSSSSIYSSVEPHQGERAKSSSSRYANVEPYQGQRVELSPLVKLKGVPKKTHESLKSNPLTLLLQGNSPTLVHHNSKNAMKQADTNEPKQVDGKNSLVPSIAELDLIDALIENELALTLKHDNDENVERDNCKRIGGLQTIEYGNFQM